MSISDEVPGADESGQTHPGRVTNLVGLGIIVGVIALDQLTKWWVLESFEWSPRHVVWTLQLVVAHNSGAAFSLFSGRGIGPAIALLAVVVVVIVIRTLRFVQGWPAVIGSALVVGGALGNLADRLFRSHGQGLLQGSVVDWIDFGWWPVFNVADMAITTGAITLGFAAFFAPSDGEDAPDPSTASPGDQPSRPDDGARTGDS